MVVDAQASITINTLSTLAVIDAIRQLDPATGTWYSLFPEGQTGYCTAGQTCWINLRLRNGGDVAGTIYLKITRTDTGAVIWNQNYAQPIGGYVDIDQINFLMPNTDITLAFEIGHI